MLHLDQLKKKIIFTIFVQSRKNVTGKKKIKYIVGEAHYHRILVGEKKI